MSPDVVKSAETREYLLATIDHRILTARASRDTNRATAHTAELRGARMVADLATSRARYHTTIIDRLLERRAQISGEAT